MNFRKWLVISASDYGVNFTEVSDGMRLKKWAWVAPKFVAFRGREYTYYVRYPLTMSEGQALKYTIAYHEGKGTEVLSLKDIGLAGEGDVDTSAPGEVASTMTLGLECNNANRGHYDRD